MTTRRAEDGSATAPPLANLLNLSGKNFRLTLVEHGPATCHWILAAPGELVMSGDATTAAQAREEALSAGHAWVDQQVASLRSAGRKATAAELVDA